MVLTPINLSKFPQIRNSREVCHYFSDFICSRIVLFNISTNIEICWKLTIQRLNAGLNKEDDILRCHIQRWSVPLGTLFQLSSSAAAAAVNPLPIEEKICLSFPVSCHLSMTLVQMSIDWNFIAFHFEMCVIVCAVHVRQFMDDLPTMFGTHILLGR